MTPDDDSAGKEASDGAPEDRVIGAALRRALDHAPDLAAQPDWRLRKAILQAGREAVMPAATAPTPDATRAAWWQRLWGGAGNSRMPWNAAFASVLVAVLVTVMWRSEPVPEARLDGEAQVALPPAGAPAPAPVAPAGPASPLPDAPPAMESAATGRERKATPPSEPAAADTTPAMKPVPERSTPQPQGEFRSTPQPQPSPLPAPAPAAPRGDLPVSGEASTAQRERSAVRRQAEERRAEEAAAPAAGTADALTDVAPSAGDAQRAAARRRSIEAAPAAGPASPAPAAPASTSAARNAAPKGAPGAASGMRNETTEPPTFAALAQWDRLVIAGAGAGRRTLSRDEATELRALMGSVAIAAVEARRFAGPVTWRLTMERNGQVLAVLELGPQQVRWREGTAPPATGVPNAGALGALRAALSASMAAQPEAAQR